MVAIMTNEQQAIYLNGLLKALRQAREHAKAELLKDQPQLKTMFGGLNTKALSKFIDIENELTEEIELLTPRFPGI